jgi:hypothetical protein
MSPALAYAVAVAVAAATLYGAIRLFGRRHAGGEGTEADAAAPPLTVLARKRVQMGRTLVIVDAGGRRLLLGSTRGAWTALADLGPADAGPSAEAGDLIERELHRALGAHRFRRGGPAR